MLLYKKFKKLNIYIKKKSINLTIQLKITKGTNNMYKHK